VVHVAGARGGNQDNQPSIERAGPVDLGERERYPFVVGRRCVHADVHADRRGPSRLAHRLLDPLGPQVGENVPPRLLGQGVIQNHAVWTPTDKRRGRRFLKPWLRLLCARLRTVIGVLYDCADPESECAKRRQPADRPPLSFASWQQPRKRRTGRGGGAPLDEGHAEQACSHGPANAEGLGQ
jgi:hypothetical protein